MTGSIPVMVYWNGNIIKTGDSIEFECAAPRIFDVKSDVNIGQLKRIIRSKIRLLPNEQIGTILNRYPQKSNITGQRLRYVRQELVDDDDIRAMIGGFKRHKCDTLELYVEVESTVVDDNLGVQGVAERAWPAWPLNTQQSEAWPGDRNWSWDVNTTCSMTISTQR